MEEKQWGDNAQNVERHRGNCLQNVSILHCLYLGISKIIPNQQRYISVLYFSVLFFIQEKLFKYPLHSRDKNKYTEYTEAKDTILVPYKNKRF